MNILVDMDNTLNQLWIPFLADLSEIYSMDMTLKREELLNYKLTSNFLNIVKDEDWFNVTNKIFCTPGIWERMPAMPHINEVITLLSEKHNVYILTKPWIHSKTVWYEKAAWIQKHLPNFNLSNLIYCANKKMIKADYIIDDAPEYLSMNNGVKTIAMDYPYNHDLKVDYRVNDWNDIKEIFRTL